LEPNHHTAKATVTDRRRPAETQHRLILGIETSCDETAASVVANGTRVLSNVVASQHDLHRRYGGVVPEIASRAHVEHMLPVMLEALREADVAPDQLHAVAVGNRPGLIGSLLVGVTAAKAAAWSLGKPLIGVDHVAAHLHAPLLQSGGATVADVSSLFPALGLVVSGGHTSLYRLAGPGEMDLLGSTIDDAAGEAFDKAAVMLGLPHPGGPRLDELAERGNPESLDLPRSLLGADSLDFSFSGLKTALLYAVRGKPVGRGKAARFERDHTDLSEPAVHDYCAAFRAAVIDALQIKLQRALDQQRDQGQDVRSILMGGGVTANRALRRAAEAFANQNSLPVLVPPMAYCMDNAAMIAGAADADLQRQRFDGLELPVASTTRLPR